MSGTWYLCLESILSALGNLSRSRDAVYHSFYLGELLRLNWGQGVPCLPISTYTILCFTTIGGVTQRRASILVEAMMPRLGVKPRALCMLGKAIKPAKLIPSPVTSI